MPNKKNYAKLDIRTHNAKDQVCSSSSSSLSSATATTSSTPTKNDAFSPSSLISPAKVSNEITKSPSKRPAESNSPATPTKRVASSYISSPSSPGSGEVNDFYGFVSYVWKGKSRNGNEYLDIKLKVAVNEFKTVRLMKNQNPSVTEQQLRTLQTGGIPIKLSTVYTTNTGTNFFNTFRGSKIQEGVQLSFNSSDQCKISIEDVKTKTTGSYTVAGCLKWLTEVETIQKSNGDEKKIRQAILLDETDHIALTIWEDLLQEDLEELVTWYSFNDVNVKDYFGIKLSTTTLTKITKLEAQHAICWENVDVAAYHNMTKGIVLSKTLFCSEILNVQLHIVPSCSSISCNQKVTVVPGVRIVRCGSCGRVMKPSSCLTTFDCTIEFDEDIKLKLPLSVLESFLKEDVISKYKDNTDVLIEKLLYLEQVDFIYNIRNVISVIDHH